MFQVSIVFITFVFMEFIAWATHKYVMHGFLWYLHEDHHVPSNKQFQKNDSFALIFAIPSASLIILGSVYSNEIMLYSGFGILAYGLAYLFVHDIFIHRRIKIFSATKNKYFKAIMHAHRLHHAKQEKENCEYFGMLFVPLSVFKSLK